ncbi:MAG: hypothetical protein U0457_19770 [Candidatus Sericytochromatia bacterium]
MNKKIILFYFLIIMFFIISCNVKKDLNNKYTKNIVLQGHVNFSTFKIKANENEISSKSLITLSYPSDYYESELKNDIIGSAVSDEYGNFMIRIPNSFYPIQNQVYVIDANKKFDNISNNISLRTLIKWDGSEFDTISYYTQSDTQTTKNIEINSKTTTLSILSNYSIIIPHDSFGKILNGILPTEIVDNTTNPATNVSSEVINKTYSFVQKALEKNIDPLSAISYKNNQLILSLKDDKKGMLSACFLNPSCNTNDISNINIININTTVSKVVPIQGANTEGIYAICVGEIGYCPYNRSFYNFIPPNPSIHSPTPTPFIEPTPIWIEPTAIAG